MSIFKRTQRKYVKKAYRVRNWREYEAGLRNRGSLTVWISLTAGKLVNWDAPRPRRRKPGRQRKYSNHAIETAVTLGMVFHLSSRQSEGLLRSLFALMKLDNDVPDHTTLSNSLVPCGNRFERPMLWRVSTASFDAGRKPKRRSPARSPRSLCCLGLSPLARFNYGASTATKV